MMTYTPDQLGRLDDALARLIHGDALPVWRGFSPSTEWADLGRVLTAPCVLALNLSIHWHEGIGIWEVALDGAQLVQAERDALPLAVCRAVARSFHLRWETAA